MKIPGWLCFGVLLIDKKSPVRQQTSPLLSLPQCQWHTPLFQIASPVRRSALRPQSFRQRMPVLHLLHPKILSCTHQLHGGTVDCACAPGHGPSLQQQRLLDFCCGTGRWQRLRSDPDLSGAQLQQTDILPCDATFPDVVIAQGSTLFRNNWWFGQRSGQHTRDSDGPDTVLAIGSTTEGRTVYASFLRGGNEVNEISLEAIHVVEAAADSANKVVDVKNKFAALPIDGVQSNLEGFPGSYDPTVNHIQGYAQYDSCDHTRYSILTHSVGTAPYAHIVAGPKTGSDKWGFKTYLQNWKHPGGVQVMGDYLLVPSEQDASAHIALYDLRSLAVKELRRVETFDLAVSHKAGALGITSYEDKNGIEYYVMIVAHLDGENTVYHVYRALASNGIENARFSEVGSFESDKDFQGFGLITEDGTNDIYMIGLWSPSEGVTFADYAYLYQLNTETWTIGEALQQIHMVSVGGMAGMMGVHFRYGANVYVADDGTLTLSATERNSVLGSSLATNDWIPAIVN